MNLRSRDLFWAAWGLCVLFFQLPMTKMVLDDPQSLYLGAWNNTTFLWFLGLSFLAVPLGVGGFFAALFKLNRPLATAAVCGAIAFFLAMEINVHYLQRYFLVAPWRREATLALFLLPLIPLWLIRYSLVRLLKVCSLFSLAVLAGFSLQASPARMSSDHESTPVPIQQQIQHPVFIFTFEKLVASYLTEPDGTFLKERFPHLGRFIETADFYPSAYANSTATVYALKSIYSGRFLTHERNWTTYPNLRDILGAHNRVYMFLDVLTQYCRLHQDIGFRTLGTSGTLGKHLLVGWYKTYLVSILPDPLEDRLPGLLGPNWVFSPLFDLWYRENDLWYKQKDQPGGASKVAVQLGVRQFEQLEEVLSQQRDHPNIYLVHSFISDNPGTKTSVLTGRSETDRLKDLEAARKNLAAFDQHLGKFFQTLKRIGIYDQSLILITSDTGYDPQATHVKGELSIPFSDEMLRVFLAIKWPEQAAGRILLSYTRQIDILPTLLAGLKIDPEPYQFEGVPVTDPATRLQIGQHPLDFSITSSLGGILHYQLTRPEGPLRLSRRIKQDVIPIK